MPNGGKIAAVMMVLFSAGEIQDYRVSATGAAGHQDHQAAQPGGGERHPLCQLQVLGAADSDHGAAHRYVRDQ